MRQFIKDQYLKFFLHSTEAFRRDLELTIEKLKDHTRKCELGYKSAKKREDPMVGDYKKRLAYAQIELKEQITILNYFNDMKQAIEQAIRNVFVPEINFGDENIASMQ